MKKLDGLFNPKSVAVIGASRDPDSVGFGVLKGLLTGGFFSNPHARPFPGKIFPINPHADKIQGHPCYKSVKDIKDKIDLAIFAVPARIVPLSMKECLDKGIKNAIIVSSGFAEFGEQGKQLQADLTKMTKGHINIVGPNCLGIINTHASLNASFAPTMPPRGSIGFITQSGALADSIIDWSIAERYGFSKIISFGNGMDLDVADFLEYLGNDKATRAIAIYLEGLKDGKKFMKIAKKVARRKPIVAIKAGRTASGEHAISSHTGSLAGSYEVYDAAFRQCGITIAKTVEELFDFAKVLSFSSPCKNGIAIITNGGGCGVLCADNCETLGVQLVPFEESLLKQLDATGKMHPAYSRRNPLDIVGDALPERYEAALDIVLSSKEVHGAIVIQTLQTMTNSVADAKIVARARRKFREKPIICTYMGGQFSKSGIRFLEDHGVPDVNDPAKAAACMKVLIDRYAFLKRT
jgi:acetyltransferase